MPTVFRNHSDKKRRLSWPTLLFLAYILALGYRGWRSMPNRTPFNRDALRSDRQLLTGPNAEFTPLPKGFKFSKVELGSGEFIAISDDGSVMTREGFSGTKVNPDAIAQYVVRRPNGKQERYPSDFATLRPDGKVVIARKNQLEIDGKVIKLSLDPSHPFALNPELFMWGADLAISAIGDYVLVVHSHSGCSLIDKNGYTRWFDGAKLKFENPLVALGRIAQVFNPRELSYRTNPPGLSASGKVFRQISDRSALYGSNTFGDPKIFEGNGQTFVETDGNPAFKASGTYTLDLNGGVIIHSTTPYRQQQWPYLLKDGKLTQMEIPGNYKSAVCVGAVDDSMMLFQSYPDVALGGLYIKKSEKFYDLRQAMLPMNGYVWIPGQPGESSVYEPFQRPLSRSGAFVVRSDGNLILLVPNMSLPD